MGEIRYLQKATKREQVSHRPEVLKLISKWQKQKNIYHTFFAHYASEAVMTKKGNTKNSADSNRYSINQQ